MTTGKMAKVLGGIASGLTIAALFRTSFEIVDIINASRGQNAELKKLRLRLNIQKCRLYLWGESMGIVDIMGEAQSPDENGLQFPSTVQTILEDLFRLFRSTEDVQRKYGYIQATPEDVSLDHEQYKPFDHLATSAYTLISDLNQPGPVTKIRRNITWVVHDRKKFTLLIDDIKDLIDKLKEITSPPVNSYRNREGMTQKMGKIRDTEALALIAGVCAADHPDITRLRRQRPLLYSQNQIDSGTSTQWSGPRVFRYGGSKL